MMPETMSSAVNRRNFLTVLSSGLVGVSLVDTQWIPTPIETTLAIPDGPLTDIRIIAAEMVRLMAAQMPSLRAEFIPGNYELGSNNGLTTQFGVDIDTFAANNESEIGARGVHELHSRRHCQPDRKSTRLNSSHIQKSRMPSSA